MRAAVAALYRPAWLARQAARQRRQCVVAGSGLVGRRLGGSAGGGVAAQPAQATRTRASSGSATADSPPSQAPTASTASPQGEQDGAQLSPPSSPALSSTTGPLRRLVALNEAEVAEARRRLPAGLRAHKVERSLTEVDELRRELAALRHEREQGVAANADSSLYPETDGAATGRAVWRKAKVSARQRAKLRMEVLARGKTWPYDVPKVEVGVHANMGRAAEKNSAPGEVISYLQGDAAAYVRALRKGHLHEVRREERRRMIAERMRDMPRLLAEHRAEKRAERARLGGRAAGGRPKKGRVATLITQRVDDDALAPAAVATGSSAAGRGKAGRGSGGRAPITERRISVAELVEHRPSSSGSGSSGASKKP